MKKFENFCRALDNLRITRDYCEPFDTVTETGIVGLFEICFEQSWKAMKEVLEEHGYDNSRTGSPKMIIKLAYSSKMISDEDVWLKALSARNDVTHSYNKEIALEIIRNTQSIFIPMFEKLQQEIRDNWL